MYFFGDKFKNIKTGQRATIVDTIALNIKLSVLNDKTGKSRHRWVTVDKLQSDWISISNEEYWA